MLRTVFDVDTLTKELSQLKDKASSVDFWKDSDNATKVQQRIAFISKEIDLWQGIKKEIKDLKDYVIAAKDDDYFLDDIEKQLKDLEDRYEKEEYRIFLSEKYDANNAYVSIYPGAGGLDASDWASILHRMYQRYCEKKKWKVSLINESYSEQGGLKEVVFFVEGLYAYGFLKGEQGVHRLVRLSPFSSASLRHTSFAFVDIFPEIDARKEEVVLSADMRVDIFRSSGPGGQNTNKRETAVRLTHIPTGLSAISQKERSQHMNKDQAYKLLCSKVYKFKMKEYNDKMDSIKGEVVSAEWGNQIRSYVLHPYNLVKDYRTEIETVNTKDVLDGDIDLFIQSFIRKIADK